MIRVLFDPEIFALQNRGGIPRVFQNLYKQFLEFPELGIQPVIPEGPWFPYLNLTNSVWTRDSALRRVSKLAASRFAFRRCLKNIDVIHHTYYTRLWVTSSHPVVTTVHDLIPEKLDTARNRIILARRRRFEISDFLVFVSRQTQHEFDYFYPEFVQPRCVIYSGLDHLAYNPIAVPLARKPFFLFVGTRSAHKRFDLLVEACWLLHASGAPPFTLMIVGGEKMTGSESTLPKTVSVNQLNATDQELCWLYRNALALVVPSDTEGFGLPPLEAAAVGGTSLVSDIPIFREVLSGHQEYFLQGSSFSLSLAMRESLDAWEAKSLQQSQRAGQEGAQLQTRTWYHCARDYAGVYTQMLSRSHKKDEIDL